MKKMSSVPTGKLKFKSQKYEIGNTVSIFSVVDYFSQATVYIFGKLFSQIK